MATADESGNGKAAAAAAPAPAPAPAAARGSSGGFSGAELALRALLFAATLAALVVLVTAEETEVIPFFVSLAPPRLAMGPRPAKFKDSPALIYLLVALCMACLYSLLTALSSLRLIKGASTAKTIFLLLLLDIFYLAVMASATGSAGGVAWIGLKGNSHTMWNKICDRYGKFCRHIGASVFLALVASILLLLLAASNACALYRRTR